MPPLWHNRGMARVRISTTVDQDLLARARALAPGSTDASVVELAHDLDADIAREPLDDALGDDRAHTVAGGDLLDGRGGKTVDRAERLGDLF